MAGGHYEKSLYDEFVKVLDLSLIHIWTLTVTQKTRKIKENS